MKCLLSSLLFLIVCILCVISESFSEEKIEKLIKNNKVFSRSIFNVVQFPNVGCAGTNSRNGTCYTSSQCNTKGGISSGSCANGYGVCCTILLGCGQTSSENCTYLVQAITSTPAKLNCIYTICPCSTNVCRIRMDFTAFQIAGPFVGSTAALQPAVINGGSIGGCVTDVFNVVSPGNRGSPDICGFNTGQHIFMDSSTACIQLSFRFGAVSTSRTYDIKVTQFNCGDEMAGPPDCLQYFTGNAGTVKSFNFNTVNNQVTSTATHLINQFYSMCFRRNSGKCAICFIPSITTGNSIANQNSFGLNFSGAAGMITSLTDSGCTGDYLIIPNGVSTAAMALGGGLIDGADRLCGRLFSSIANSLATTSICTGRRPFRLTFMTDSSEFIPTVGSTTANDEQFMAPGGIIGYSLDFVQQACP